MANAQRRAEPLRWTVFVCCFLVYSCYFFEPQQHQRIYMGVMTKHSEDKSLSLLVLRCQMGDHSAFDRVVELYQGPLLCFVGSLLGRPQGVEDIVQSVWLTVVRKICTLKNPYAFNVWLYQIARHKVYQDLRRTKQLSPLVEVGGPVGQTCDISIKAEKEEDIEKLYACLRRLKPEHREVLMLQFLEQMSLRQITEVTGCKMGTIKSRSYYAKLALKQEMERSS